MGLATSDGSIIPILSGMGFVAVFAVNFDDVTTYRRSVFWDDVHEDIVTCWMNRSS
jgi:hypothetical protein